MNSVSISPETINSISGTSATFTCQALGGVNNTFEWMNVQTGAVVSMSEVLTIVASAQKGGTYQCRVSNLAGEETELATLNGKKARRANVYIYCIIFSVNPLILADPEAINVTAHTDGFVLMCLVSGHPVPTVSWLHNGTALSETTNVIIATDALSDEDFGQARGTLSVEDPEISDSGLYQCVASNLDAYNDAMSMEVLVIIQGESLY